MGPLALLPLQSKAYCGFLLRLKIHGLSLVSSGKHTVSILLRTFTTHMNAEAVLHKPGCKRAWCQRANINSLSVPNFYV
jgi:hypothetical protein